MSERSVAWITHTPAFLFHRIKAHTIVSTIRTATNPPRTLPPLLCRAAEDDDEVDGACEGETAGAIEPLRGSAAPAPSGDTVLVAVMRDPEGAPKLEAVIIPPAGAFAATDDAFVPLPDATAGADFPLCFGLEEEASLFAVATALGLLAAFVVAGPSRAASAGEHTTRTSRSARRRWRFRCIVLWIYVRLYQW